MVDAFFVSERKRKKMKNRQIHITFLLLMSIITILLPIKGYAYDQYENIKVGETKTYYFPSEVSSKANAMYSYNCSSDHINNIEVVSYTKTSVTVSALEYTSSRVNIRFDYWWQDERGSNRTDTHYVHIDMRDDDTPDDDPDTNPDNYKADYGCWGTITLNKGEYKTVSNLYSMPYPDKVKSVVWTENNSNGFEIIMQSNSSCTIKGISPNVGQKLWCLMKYGNSTYKAYYLVNVEEPYNPTEGTVFEYNGVKYSVVDSQNKTCKVGKYWETEEGSGKTSHYVSAVDKTTSDKVIIPSKVSFDLGPEHIGDYTVTEVAPYAFYISSLSEIILPNTITTIGSRAFYDCSNLTTVTAPSSILFVGEFAFAGTPWLKNQPEGVVYVGQAAYHYSGEFSYGATITIRDGTKSVSPGFLYNMSSRSDRVKTIKIPSSIMSIGDLAFRDCLFVEDVFSDIVNPFEISNNTFGLAYFPFVRHVLYVPDGSKQLYVALDGWNKFDIVEQSVATSMKGRKVCNIDKATFPDDNFRSLLLTEEYGSDAMLTEWELWRLIYLSVESHISDMKGIEYLTSLKSLNVSNNDLISLDLSKNTELRSVWCGRNNISGKAMDNLINSLPINDTDTDFKLYVYDNRNGDERNVCTKVQVANAKAKGWTPLYYDAEEKKWKEYEGSEDEESALKGDVNGDGEVSGTDYVALTNMILGKTEKKSTGDVNGDGQVSGTDYVTLVNIILGKK